MCSRTFPGTAFMITIAPMKHPGSTLGAVVLLSAVWIALNESLSWYVVASGPVVAVTAIYFSDKFVLKGDFAGTYRIGPWTLVKYTAYLVSQVYVAGFAAMYRLARGSLNLDIVHIHTELDSEFHISLLANSITLTPGTVTVDKQGRKLDVLWIDAHTHDAGEAGDEIKGGFERLLRGDEDKRNARA